MFATKGDNGDALLKDIETLQGLLPDKGPFLLGDRYTAAEIAVSPFFGRLELALKDNLGAISEEDGKRIREAYFGPKFDKIRKYIKATTERKSFKDTFPAEKLVGFFKRFLAARKN